jgi:proteasome lid subunit RPN8/RPN11
MKNFWFGLVAVFAGCTSAWGADPTKFDNINEAAAHAFYALYNDHPHAYEYGGVIFKTPDGKFVPSAPDSDVHSVDHTEIDHDPEHYEIDGAIVADYHSHPCVIGYHTGQFSPADLHSSRETQTMAFMLDECTGDIHEWTPGDPYDKPEYHVTGLPEGIVLPPEVLKHFAGPQLAVGKIVGHIKVDGKKIVL